MNDKLKDLEQELKAARRALAQAKIDANAAEQSAQWAVQRRVDAAQRVGRLESQVAKYHEQA